MECERGVQTQRGMSHPPQTPGGWKEILMRLRFRKSVPDLMIGTPSTTCPHAQGTEGRSMGAGGREGLPRESFNGCMAHLSAWSESERVDWRVSVWRVWRVSV